MSTLDLLIFSLGRAITPAVFFVIGFIVLRAGLRSRRKEVNISAKHAFVGPLFAFTLIETFLFRPATGLFTIAALTFAIVGIVLLIVSALRSDRQDNDGNGNEETE